MSYKMSPSYFHSNCRTSSVLGYTACTVLAPNAFGAATGEDLQAHERGEVLQKKLLALDSDFYEDYESALDEPSRAAFLTFMNHAPWVRIPMIAADSEGKIVATWEKPNLCLTVRFADRFSIHYAMTVGTGKSAKRSWGESLILYFLAEHPEAAEAAR